MQDEEIITRGWSVPIYRAIEAAGGAARVASGLGLESSQTPMHWYKTRSIKAQYIIPLCVLSGYKVQPDEILQDVTQAREVA
jgi:hypothetical protein